MTFVVCVQWSKFVVDLGFPGPVGPWVRELLWIWTRIQKMTRDPSMTGGWAFEWNDQKHETPCLRAGVLLSVHMMLYADQQVVSV